MSSGRSWQSMITVRLPSSYGLGEGIGRCTVSWRSPRASWRDGWWLATVGCTWCLWAGRRTATASPAATGHGRARDHVRAVVRGEQCRSGAKGDPGEVGRVVDDGLLWRARGASVHVMHSVSGAGASSPGQSRACLPL